MEKRIEIITERGTAIIITLPEGYRRPKNAKIKIGNFPEANISARTSDELYESIRRSDGKGIALLGVRDNEDRAISVSHSTYQQICKALDTTNGEPKPKPEPAKMLKIHIATRGWGENASLEWHGEASKSDAEIIAECRERIAKSTDVDAIPSDEKLMKAIADAREKIRPATKEEKAEAKLLRERLACANKINYDTIG